MIKCSLPSPSGRAARVFRTLLLASSILNLASGAVFAIPLGSSVSLDTPDGPRSVAPGDFNGDGYIDLAVTCQGTGEVVVWYGSADGQLTDRISITLNQVRGITAADFNEDGRSDLAVLHFSTRRIPVSTLQQSNPRLHLL